MGNPSAQTASDITAFFDISDKERKTIAWEYIIFEALTFIHFSLAFMGYVPYWTFCIAVFWYIPRWMIALHEQQHFCTPKNINIITRHNLLILTPFQLGYCEMRDIHMRHHAHGATEKDPEYYHIKGHWFAGFINVFFSPEQSVYFWLKEKKVDAELVRGMLIRFSLFVAIVAICGWQSLWYFIPVRLAYGSCLFFFSYCLHRKDGEYGTFSIQYPGFLRKLMHIFYGNTLLHSVSEHDIHHDYPRVPGNRLGEARPYYVPRRSAMKQAS
jgi:fatty acid desaturase